VLDGEEQQVSRSSRLFLRIMQPVQIGLETRPGQGVSGRCRE